MEADDSNDSTITKIFTKIGSFGKFQTYSFILGCLAVAMSGMSIVNIIFVGKELPHRCLIKECEDTTTVTKFDEEFLNFTTPDNLELNQIWDKCKAYSVISSDQMSNISSCQSIYFDEFNFEPCTKYVYDTSVFRSTVISEFNIVCDQAWLQPMGNTLYLVGAITGSILMGELGDRIGRKKAIVISLLLIVIGGLGCALAPNYYLFLLTRFIIGNTSVFQLGFVLVVEYMSPKWRNFCGIIIEVPFALGEAVVAVFAYYIRDWRWLQVACSIPSILLLSYWWILPESIRWLIATGRKDEASELIRKIGKWNKIDVSSCLDLLKEQDSTSLDVTEKAEIELDGTNDRRILDILKYPQMRNRSIILCVIWVTVNMCYYGLSANTVNLDGDIFVNFAAVMLIEIPSYVFAYLLLDRIGRKGTMCLVLLIGGAACLISGLLSKELSLLIVVMSSIGKFGISAGLAIVFIVTAEIFPTNFRSLAIGVFAMLGNVGSVAGPYVSYLDTYYSGLPLLIFGTMGVISLVLSFLLPETLGKELPQNWQESEDLGKNQGLFYFSICTNKRMSKEESSNSSS